MPVIIANDENAIAVTLESNRRHFADIFQHADAADCWSRQNRTATASGLAFIIQRHIARHDRVIQRSAGVAHPFETAHDLRHDFGALRVGEIQAVRDRKRRCANCADVAIGFGHGLLAAFIRVGITIARRAVGAHRQRAVRSVNADDRCIAARKLRCVTADLAVILLPDPCTAREVRACHQLQQIRADIAAGRNVAQGLHIGPCLISFFRRGRPVVQRCIFGERSKRNVANDLTLPRQHHVASVGDFADHRKIQFPFVENCLGKFLAAGLEHHEHAFLAFRQHHFIGGHALFATRHLVHVENDAGLAVRGHFDA